MFGYEDELKDKITRYKKRLKKALKEIKRLKSIMGAK